jgi:hypothetical protein
MSKETEIQITFEQKKEALIEIVKDYGMGFMTIHGFIAQIFSIPWNEFEMSLVEQTLDKCFEFKFDSFNIFLGLKN